MLTILRQTDSTDRAGDQSSVRIDRQMCPLLYTWGWTGIFDPPNITYTHKTSVNSLMIAISYKIMIRDRPFFFGGGLGNF